MAKLTMRIPSKAVQYGYIEFEVNEPDAATSPEMMAAMYVNYVYAFQKEEQEALRRLSESLTNEAPTGAPDNTTAAHKKAVQALDEGLGGVTELSDEELTSLGGTVGEFKTSAPWDKPAVDTPKKPWETEVTAPVVLDAAW